MHRNIFRRTEKEEENKKIKKIVCRVLSVWHSAKKLFAECFLLGTRQTTVATSSIRTPDPLPPSDKPPHSPSLPAFVSLSPSLSDRGGGAGVARGLVGAPAPAQRPPPPRGSAAVPALRRGHRGRARGARRVPALRRRHPPCTPPPPAVNGRRWRWCVFERRTAEATRWGLERRPAPAGSGRTAPPEAQPRAPAPTRHPRPVAAQPRLSLTGDGAAPPLPRSATWMAAAVAPSPDLRCGWPPPLPHVDGRVRHRRLPLLVVRPPGPDLRWCPRPSLACGGAAPPLPDSNGNGAAPAFPRRPAGGAAGVWLGLLQGGGGGGRGGGWFFYLFRKLFAEC